MAPMMDSGWALSWLNESGLSSGLLCAVFQVQVQRGKDPQPERDSQGAAIRHAGGHANTRMGNAPLALPCLPAAYLCWDSQSPSLAMLSVALPLDTWQRVNHSVGPLWSACHIWPSTSLLCGTLTGAEKALQAEAVQRFKSGDGKRNSPHCLCRLMYRQRRLSQHVTYCLPHSTVSSRAVTQHATLELHLFQTRRASGLSSQQTAVALRVGHLPVATRKVLDNSLHLRCLQTQAVLHAARQWRCLQTEAAQQAEETFVIVHLSCDTCRLTWQCMLRGRCWRRCPSLQRSPP